ncbi:MAG: hypothetical protein KAK00_10830 [Nanoarchaeota archaeon]|nr:hypothetical protein [Nanoarchaeota archaeon]
MKLILSLLIIIFVVVTGCSEVDTNSIDDSPEATFRIIEIGVKDCNFENIVNLLSPSVYEKPFGKEYIDLSNNCNNLVSNMDCINSCSSNENFFQKYGYSCEQVCNADCTSRKIVLEIGCIFNTRNYQKHITSFEINNIIKVSESGVILNVTRIRDFEFAQIEDEKKVIDVNFINEENQWKINSPLYIFE